MILGIKLYRDEDAKSASIVPLAFPLIAGAGTMTTLLSLRSQYHPENIVVAIVGNIIMVYVVLKSSAKIEKALGKTGLGVVEKPLAWCCWPSLLNCLRRMLKVCSFNLFLLLSPHLKLRI
jgi:hypothetical protein